MPLFHRLSGEIFVVIILFIDQSDADDIIFDDSSDIRAKIKTAVFLGAQFSYFIELGGQEFRVQRNTLDSLDDRE
ncbi:MAG: hypothetical protein II704_00895, partial [Erysipelotrichaceae bacterium]|nr:hypothetical protein [Erysipelotrichaceae bacterium]